MSEPTQQLREERAIPMTPTSKTAEKDWTCDERGFSNSSEEFDRLARDIASVLSDTRLGHDLYATAGLILARLAHVHGLAPKAEAGA